MVDKADFLGFLARSGALRFGDFVTKSGRNTPYFINMGMFASGSALERLSEAYADIIAARFGGRFDNLFGPAYKGIPLCAAAAMALHRRHGLDPSFTYNRKEAKDHGEGGILVGDTYQAERRVLIVEDVITAGTSLRETMDILSRYPNAKAVGLVVSVDRRERLDSGKSALREAAEAFGIETAAIVSIDDIIEYLGSAERRRALGLEDSILERISDYRARYGAQD
jgi:orotate phosphoribosyltransferase